MVLHVVQECNVHCSEKGKPTVTTNVNCQELWNNLKSNQSPYDHPDLICQIFEMKHLALLWQIKRWNLWWMHCSCVHHWVSKERCSTHAFNIWIKNFEETPNNINNDISTEIPQQGTPSSNDRELMILLLSTWSMAHVVMNTEQSFLCRQESKWAMWQMIPKILQSYDKCWRWIFFQWPKEVSYWGWKYWYQAHWRDGDYGNK